MPSVTTTTNTPPASPTTDHDEPEHGQTGLCQYRSKKCWNPRAVKQNGSVHKLCDFHRERANLNQRRLEQRRKARKGALAAASPASTRQQIQYDWHESESKSAFWSEMLHSKPTTMHQQYSPDAYYPDQRSSVLEGMLMMSDPVIHHSYESSPTEPYHSETYTRSMPPQDLEILNEFVFDTKGVQLIDVRTSVRHHHERHFADAYHSWPEQNTMAPAARYRDPVKPSEEGMVWNV